MNLSITSSIFLFFFSRFRNKDTVAAENNILTMSEEPIPNEIMEVAFASVGMMGHFKPLIPFIRDVHRRGHKVTVFLDKNPKYEQELAKEGVMRGDNVDIVAVDLKTMEELQEAGGGGMIGYGGPLALISQELYPSITSYYKHATPDVLVHGFFATAAADAADFMKVPAVTVCPNPLTYDWYPTPDKRSVWHHMKAFGFNRILFKSFLMKTFKFLRNKERKARNLPMLKRQDVFPNSAQQRHVISTTGDGFEFIQDRSKLLHLVGPSAPATPESLGDDLRNWLDDQQKPVVYVAFGTAYEFDENTLSNLSSEIMNISNNVSILWSLPAVQQRLLPPDFPKLDNWRFETFVPQWSVLQHPNVKMFVTHCGSNSVYESLLNEVPMIACPTGRDQFANGARINAAGVGLVVKNGANGNVAETIMDINKNLSTYEMAARCVKEKFGTQGGAKKGGDIIELAARQGYKELGKVEPLNL